MGVDLTQRQASTALAWFVAICDERGAYLDDDDRDTVRALLPWVGDALRAETRRRLASDLRRRRADARMERARRRREANPLPAPDLIETIARGELPPTIGLLPAEVEALRRVPPEIRRQAISDGRVRRRNARERALREMERGGPWQRGLARMPGGYGRDPWEAWIREVDPDAPPSPAPCRINAAMGVQP